MEYLFSKKDDEDGKKYEEAYRVLDEDNFYLHEIDGDIFLVEKPKKSYTYLVSKVRDIRAVAYEFNVDNLVKEASRKQILGLDISEEKKKIEELTQWVKDNNPYPEQE